MHDPALRERAQELRKQGLLIREIVDELTVSKPTVTRWLNPELEQRGRIRARKLKWKGARLCPRCKQHKKSRYAKVCRRCQLESIQPNRIWTREKVIKAIQDWALQHGYAPVHEDWSRTGPGHPAISSILAGPHPLFRTWGEALEAAGFQPRVRRSPKWDQLRKDRSDLAKRQRRAELRRQTRENRVKTALEKENKDGHATGVRDDADVPDPAGGSPGGAGAG